MLQMDETAKESIHGFDRRNHAELLHEAQGIRTIPYFDDFAVCRVMV